MHVMGSFMKQFKKFGKRLTIIQKFYKLRLA